ncbi:DoxX family membrane protein [Chromobacterium haemolyticum]|nr:DoxX family membrane protein [Chromobacterium haemolyticum]
MNPLTCSRLSTPYRWLIRGGDLLQPLLLLLFRLWIANVFFKSGLTKIDDWDTTILLFTEEYHVPLLPPAVAAALAAAGELGLSALLALGLGGRFAAAGLFILRCGRDQLPGTDRSHARIPLLLGHVDRRGARLRPRPAVRGRAAAALGRTLRGTGLSQPPTRRGIMSAPTRIDPPRHEPRLYPGDPSRHAGPASSA